MKYKDKCVLEAKNQVSVEMKLILISKEIISNTIQGPSKSI